MESPAKLNCRKFGELVRTCPESTFAVPPKRIAEVRRSLAKVQALPGLREDRMKVIERSVMTCLYFRDGASLSGAQIRELRGEVWIAARAGKDTYFNEAC